jgi:D-beta-D-heptose 7-phosphate kinase/D-beta-D-heptose 1-phosphate adenosyltransferase
MSDRMTTQNPNRHLLEHGLPHFEGCTVLVLGDIMLDRYVMGDVQRISPEGPILVLRYATSHMVLGGAGNVANNIAALGARAILIGAVGDDALGHDLPGSGVAIPSRVVLRTVMVPGRPTTMKTRFMSGMHQLLRLDEEITSELDRATGAAILQAYAECLQEADVVILSDYAKGVLSNVVLSEAIALARDAGKPVIADPKRASFSAYRHVTAITPNEMELTRATGIAISSNEAAVEASQFALQASEATAILLTRSEKGLALIERGREPLHLPTEARAVADVSGAGDTLVATFAVMLAGGAPLAEAAALANVAAGVAVGKPGTATVTQAELLAALHRQEFLALDEKMLTLDGAVARLAAWRRAGLKIGFTNGCFDLIHPGHVRLLNKARARCDRLVVGLNTDASVQRLKGPTRPVQNELARTTVMASIGAVDLVMLFDEDTPLELIQALRPDLLFKGADYRIDQVVGGDFVSSYGGQVSLIDLEQGHSTTGIIKRMNISA